ncbi:MAG: hypothetical protein KF900_10115 [Bacteroidetes bacterium]|nr:hypothetical protein [Bacteroidota bacterium]
MKIFKHIIIGMAYFFMFSQADCKKKENCHSKIIIQNKSNTPVICGEKRYDGSNNCNIVGQILKSNDNYELVFGQFSCWENTLSGGKTKDIYIIDTATYNNPNVFYSCDSMEYKNTILKHFILTLDDLKKNNFTIAYP